MVADKAVALDGAAVGGQVGWAALRRRVPVATASARVAVIVRSTSSVSPVTGSSARNVARGWPVSRRSAQRRSVGGESEEGSLLRPPPAGGGGESWT